VTGVQTCALPIWELASVKSWLRIVHPEDRPGWERRLAASPKDFEVEYRVLDRAGSTRWIRTKGSIARTRTGAPALAMGFSEDITARKRAEAEARQNQERLFQANKLAALGTLVSGVAHEINNPTTFILLNAPVLGRIWEDLKPILADWHRRHGEFQAGGLRYERLLNRVDLLLADISEGARRIKGIVADLKDYARHNPGDLVDQVDLNAVVGKAVDLTANLVATSTDRFSVAYAPALPRLKGHAQRLEQVAVNLLINACQALPGRDRAIRVATEHDPAGRRLRLIVADEGVGVAPEALPHLTDPFFTTKRDAGGTGLGLAVSASIVQRHGGRMKFDSQVMVGTTVTVELPLSGADGETAP
jgi:polar amino acid transport system substrate-binding protein